jgi:hypothetical protein
MTVPSRRVELAMTVPSRRVEYEATTIVTSRGVRMAENGAVRDARTSDPCISRTAQKTGKLAYLAHELSCRYLDKHCERSP